MGHVASNRTLTSANPIDVALVDGNGDQITSFGGGTGGTAHTDDAAFSIGSAASITPAGFLADEVAPDSVDEGDVGVARMTLNRLQLAVISDASSEKRVGVVDLTTRDALAIAVVDGNGDQITSFQPAPLSTIYNGRKVVTTAGTRVTLASSQAVSSVTIKALSTNTGKIYVGDGSVASTNGFQLAAGETISMDIANLATVNLDAAVNGEGVTYLGIA